MKVLKILTNPVSFRKQILTLAMLFSIAVAHPLFDVISKSPQFFVVRDSPRTELVLFVLLLTIAPVVVFSLFLGLIQRISKPAAAFLFWVLVVILSSVIFLPVLKAASLIDPLMIPLSVALGIALTALILNVHKSRFTTGFFWVVVMLVPALFLIQSSMLRILRPNKTKISTLKASFTPPIVFIVFDELPLPSLLNEAGELDAKRYPNFAGLVEHFTWYRNATSVADETTAAIPALLTGKYPVRSRLPSAYDYPENLLSLLSGSYEMRVVEPITKFYPQGNLLAKHPAIVRRVSLLFADAGALFLNIILPENCTTNLPSVTETWGNFWERGDTEGTRQRKEHLRLFLEGLRPAERPQLHFLHLMLPHRPWHFLPSGKNYNFPKMIQIGKLDRWKTQRSLHRHLLQVGYTDHVLGELLAKLKQSGLYDRALIIFTADHGISFRDERHRRIAIAANLQDIISIPLFVKLADQNHGSTEERNVELVDLVPTIADILKLELPWKSDGFSLINTHSLRKTKTLFDRETGNLVNIPANFPLIPKSVRNKVRLFGNDSDLYWLKSSPYGDMIGRRVEELSIQESELIVDQDHRPFYRNVKLQSNFLPAYIAGRIRQAAASKESVQLAIALNGRICAITETISLSKTEQGFGAIVPESCFQEGENLVEFYEVRENLLWRISENEP